MEISKHSVIGWSSRQTCHLKSGKHDREVTTLDMDAPNQWSEGTVGLLCDMITLWAPHRYKESEANPGKYWPLDYPPLSGWQVRLLLTAAPAASTHAQSLTPIRTCCSHMWLLRKRAEPNLVLPMQRNRPSSMPLSPIATATTHATVMMPLL